MTRVKFVLKISSWKKMNNKERKVRGKHEFVLFYKILKEHGQEVRNGLISEFPGSSVCLYLYECIVGKLKL